MVVGEREDIKTRFLQLSRKGFRLAEAVADLCFAALFELAALIKDGSLKVAKGYICGFDKGCDAPEQLCSGCWQCLGIGVVGSQHDVADGGDGDAGYDIWLRGNNGWQRILWCISDTWRGLGRRGGV